MKSALRFAPLVLLIAVNTMLLFRIHSDTRKQSADLKQLEGEVDQKIEHLKALAAEVGQASRKLKGQADSLRSQADKLNGQADSLRSQADSLLSRSANVCAIIHKPSSGCPGGYVQEKRPRFTERDGSKEFACISRDPSKEPCTDVLKPGESMGLFFQIPVPEPDEPPKSKI